MEKLLIAKERFCIEGSECQELSGEVWSVKALERLPTIKVSPMKSRKGTLVQHCNHKVLDSESILKEPGIKPYSYTTQLGKTYPKH